MKMLIELIAANNFKRMPWKNGKGETTELIAINDPLTNDLLCRLSIASVTQDGDFSDFSCYQRTLMMIAGNGITLSHQTPAAQTPTQIPAQALTRQYQYCSFDGGWKTKAKLIDGSITDFNVIFNPQRISAKVFVIKEGESNDLKNQANELFLYAHKEPSTCSLLNGKVPKKIEIPKGDLLHISNSDAANVTVSGEGLICVEIVNC
jgi:environmental stress-induced protein Ves